MVSLFRAFELSYIGAFIMLMYLEIIMQLSGVAQSRGWEFFIIWTTLGMILFYFFIRRAKGKEKS
jgi:hypothetical protein